MSDVIDAMADALDINSAGPATLLDASELDPPPGAPMRVSGELVEPGKWHEFADRWTRLPPDCPVIPLGRQGKTFFFLNAQGEVDSLDAKSSGKGPVGALFAGRSRYLEWAWPRFDKSGKKVVGWEADDARQALMDACAFVGVYDPDRTRGRGAWMDEAGGLVYHAGDRVLVGGVWKKPGRHGHWVYPARPEIGTPSPRKVKGGRHGPADVLLEILQTWNWRRKAVDAELLLGWLAMSMVAGALSWRSMVFITAEFGSGKSTLHELMKLVLGRGMLHSVNTSGAYLYQKLGHDSIPVCVDELEAQAGGVTSKAVAIVELIRTAASGGRIGRGTSEGVARDYECRSPFVCTSINIPPMRAQDLSRFAILTLDPFEKAKADTGLDWKLIEDLGRQLQRRMIDGWPRWAETLRAFKTALIEQGGHDARGAEQFGALLAAAHLAQSDDAPTADDLARWAGLLAVERTPETAGKTADWRQCLNHLMDVIPEGLRNKDSKIPNLGSRLAVYRRTGKLDDVLHLCAQVGLALTWRRAADGSKSPPTWENARLFIPNGHPETRKLFRDTTWEGVAGATGVWHTTLQRAPADVVESGPCRKGLDKQRWGVYVDLAKAFPALGEDGEQDDDDDGGGFV